MLPLAANADDVVTTTDQQQATAVSIYNEMQAINLRLRTKIAREYDSLNNAEQDNPFTIPEVPNPMHNGFLGVEESAVTSIKGNRDAKLEANDPRLAAKIVELLNDAGVESGDKVAVTWTGSLPAVNSAVWSAALAKDVKIEAVHSAASSQYGANIVADPDTSDTKAPLTYLWLDVEHEMAKKLSDKLQRPVMRPTIATTIGGTNDNGGNIEDADFLRDYLKHWDQTHQFRFAQRQQKLSGYKLRLEALSPDRFDALINVGGGTAALGSTEWAKENLAVGLNTEAPDTPPPKPALAYTYLQNGKPVIYLRHVDQLLKKQTDIEKQ